MTREQLDEMEDYDQEPFTGFNHYTLLGENSENVRYAGTCKRKAVRTLDPTIDCVSLVIRHHLSREEARAYYFGLDDCSADTRMAPFYKNEDGIFTLITRPTRPSWPGPLIIYCADGVPADNPFGESSWEVAVAPDGTLMEPFDDFEGF